VGGPFPGGGLLTVSHFNRFWYHCGNQCRISSGSSILAVCRSISKFRYGNDDLEHFLKPPWGDPFRGSVCRQFRISIDFGTILVTNAVFRLSLVPFWTSNVEFGKQSCICRAMHDMFGVFCSLSPRALDIQPPGGRTELLARPCR
jgi:hypothetical protein